MTKSSKKAQASRDNGSKSKGPKSKEGKSKSSQNAIQKGLFARQIVIEKMGEKQKDFDQIKSQLFKTLQPSNTLEEILVMDVAENWWRRERIRRAEAIELGNRYETAKLQKELDVAAQVQRQKERFFLLITQFQAAPPGKDRIDIQKQLAEVRQQLGSTTEGIRVLLDTLEEVKKRAEENGVLSLRDRAKVLACLGPGDEKTRYCLALSELNSKMFQPKPEQEQPVVTFDSELAKLTEQERVLVRIAQYIRLSRDRYAAEKYGNQMSQKQDSQERADKDSEKKNRAEPDTQESRTEQPDGQKSKTEQPDAQGSETGADKADGAAEQANFSDMDEAEETDQGNFPDMDGLEEIDIGTIDLEKVKAEIETNKDKKEYREIFYRILARSIESCREPLILKEYDLRKLEETEAEVAPWLALIDPTTADRFSRAETAVERRMYRALAALAAMRTQEPPNLLSPGIPESRK